MNQNAEKSDEKERDKVRLRGMYRICREIFGTDDVEELKEIARKARLYDEQNIKDRPQNVRNAGRKARFGEEEIAGILQMDREGRKVTEIAEIMGTSRQTIYKYLENEKRLKEDANVTMRMKYMYNDVLCTVIDVDFLHQKIYIDNRVNVPVFRAFGVIEHPTWEDFEYFLESRCFPRSRAGLKRLLKELGIAYYDPLLIIEKTQGRMAEDHHWIEIIHKEDII